MNCSYQNRDTCDNIYINKCEALIGLNEYSAKKTCFLQIYATLENVILISPVFLAIPQKKNINETQLLSSYQNLREFT